MSNAIKKLLGYAGPLEPKKSKNFLDWICSGISVLIVVGALIGIVIWQSSDHKDMRRADEPCVKCEQGNCPNHPIPSSDYNPANKE